MKVSTHGIRPSEFLFGVLLAASATASAGDVQFDPTLSLGAFYNSNVEVLGPASQSAGSVSLLAELPVTYRTAKDTLVAGYKPARTAYPGEEGLDFTAHALSLSWSRVVSRRADFSMLVDASRTERQGISPDAPDAPLTFVQRTRIGRAGLSIGGRIQAGQGSTVTWDVRGRGVKYGDDALNDAWGVGALISWSAQTGENTSNGVSYGFDWFEYQPGDTSPDQSLGATSVHTLSWRTGSRIGRNVTTSVGLGVSHSTSSGTSYTSGSLDASISRNVGDVSVLSAGLRQSVAPGGGSTGPTQDRGAFLSWRYVPPRHMTVGLTAGYWRREAIDFLNTGANPADTRATSIAATFAWQFGRWVALGVSGNYSWQKSPDTRFRSAGLFLRWNVRGR